MKIKLVSQHENIKLLLPILKSIGYIDISELDGEFCTKNHLVIDTFTKIMSLVYADDVIEFDVTDTLNDIEQWKQGKLICFQGLENCYEIISTLYGNDFVKEIDADITFKYKYWTIKGNKLLCTDKLNDAVYISNPNLVKMLYELLTYDNAIIKVLSHIFKREVVESYLIKYGHCIKKGSFVLLGQGYDEFELKVLCFTGKFGNFL